MDKLARFSVSLPAPLLDRFDSWIEARGYRTRSDALRQLIRRFISESYWEDGEKIVFGTVTLTYDHHSHDSASEITNLQHEFGDLIICSTHIHADYHHCFESVVFKGKASRVKEFVRQLSGLKDVSSSDPVISSIP
ncbi:MAG: nickel-responsive transcriptional regulator NikR [Thermovirgaceae bacterium]|nr:nickel-responsive transcriptional regulator NikR [Synergistales bacterium]MDI9391970.1 nickel-responsive transcriptional regulator NikR [Synergistota bacterium]MDY0178481.1 nickel-responsive transcriptional regulator NikR [Synergistaceae bacterium]HRW87474.1 nickel-responsive transcriptional regulator NikR [Thermovirgaceae bacterium]MDD3134211.1 nickel-responsive transcriptional regulator NikR [Synergistales bacterium]